MTAAKNQQEWRGPELLRFEILRPLGDGATGIIFEAFDRERNERVALKTLRSLDGETLLQLKSEFRALQDIEHPNLIRLGELVCEGETWFFTMELIDGETFHAYVTGDPGDGVTHSTTRGAHGGHAKARASSPSLDRTPTFDEPRLRAALTQLARGLGALHASGKVHRDIKPSNVLVARDGRVVILDLGLAREMESTAEEFVVGTALYMAPEQIMGGNVDPACDWYGVGVVLYLCLTGRHPIEGSSSDVMARKLVVDPPPPSALVPGIPADLDDLCVELLRRNPADRPTGAQVLARFESSRASVAPVVTALRPFVGRGPEAAALSRALADACSGRTVVVVVEGESGVGKSALVRQFTRSLPTESGRALLLAGRCYERETVPYKAVDGVVDSLSEFLSRLPEADVASLAPRGMALLTKAFPVLQRAAGQVRAASLYPKETKDEGAGRSGGRSDLLTSFRELFTQIAMRYQLVVAIDDLQWADADSLLLLNELLRPPLAPPLLLVATARTQAHLPDGATFGLPGDVRVVKLARLTPKEGVELATMLLGRMQGSLDPALASSIAAEAGGHPLFVDELVRHAQIGRAAPGTVVALDDALSARVAQLPVDARRMLELLAVAGVALRQETAMRAAGLGFAEFSASLKTLRVGHLARTSPVRGEDQVETYHDRVREAVSARLDPARRREIHEELARALEATAAQDADALATHWTGAGDLARGLQYTLLAADQAYRALAFERAAHLYKLALLQPSLGDDERQTANVRLADALSSSGRGREAAEAYTQAALRARGDEALDLRRRAAEHLVNTGCFDEGDAALRQVLAAVGLHLPRSPLAALLGLLVARTILWFRGMRFAERAERDVPAHQLTRLDACAGVAALMGVVDTILASHFQTKTLLLALQAGEPTRVAISLAREGTFLSSRGSRNARSAADVWERAVALGRRTGHSHVVGAITGARAFGTFLQCDFRESLRLSEVSVEMLRHQAALDFRDLRMAQLFAIWSLSWMGELADLAERVELRVREADARGDLYAATCLRVGPPSIAALRGDDPKAARAAAADAMRHWTQRGYHNQHYWSLLVNAQIDLYEGDGPAAYARVISQWPRMQRSLMLQVEIIKVEATHLRARAALAVASRPGAPATLLREAARDARALARSAVPPGRPMADAARAAIASLTGRKGDAIPLLERAIEGFEEAAMKLHAHAASWQLGHLLGGDRGAALVGTADAWMRGQGIVNPVCMVRMLVPGF